MHVRVGTVRAMASERKPLKVILAERVGRITEERPAQLAKRCYYQSGTKKGRKVSPRGLGYALDGRPDGIQPSIDVIEALAVALGCNAWELLVDEDEVRQQAIERMLGRKPPQT